MIGYKLRNQGARKGFEASTSADDELRRQYVPGDIAWIKIHDSSWWPTQVVDEKSLAVRPKKKKKDDILVRLYGSSKYLYVNPLKCMEFESIVNKQSINVKEEFQKALEKELSCIMSRDNSNGKASEFKENPMADFPRDKVQNQAGTSKYSKAVASPPGASFNESYETKVEVEERHVMKHVAARYMEADKAEAQNSRLTGKLTSDAFEVNDNKQGETHSNKKKGNGASRIKTKDQDILRRSPRNKTKEDEHVMKHAAAEDIEGADENEAQKSRARGNVRADASEATDNKQGEAHSNKGKERNGLSKIKTINQGTLRQSLRNKTKEETAEAVNLSPSKAQTAEKCMSKISYLLQNGNDVDSEIKNSRQSLTVPSLEENVRSGVSRKKNTKQSEMSSLKNRASKDEVTKQVSLKKRKHTNAHEEAKRLVILELAKHRDLGGKRSQQNDLVKEQPVQAVSETKRQCMNDGIKGSSRDENVRQDGSSFRKPEKSQSTQSPCITSNHSPEEIGDISARKTRVMQSLGLVAPPGSPFRRDGMVQAACLKF